MHPVRVDVQEDRFMRFHLKHSGGLEVDGSPDRFGKADLKT
jgi:hypothetical protein